MYSLQGTYVINNPFSSGCDDKCLQNQICEKLGIPIPKTVLIPSVYKEKNYTDLINDIDWSKFRNFPLILKPYDGYAWDDVYTVRSPEEIGNLLSATSSRKVFIAQEI
jgi:glutathione synthase/RimK-type ligase-like ATP-grasp enzyme